MRVPLLLPALSVASLAVAQQPVEAWLDGAAEHLGGLYRHLHEHPELSLREQETAARMADELRALGLEVTEKVGGTGVVGVLRCGDGPTVLIRADMDALPVAEETGLAYASKIRAEAADGRAIGVMHACGHDLHMTCLVGVAGYFAANRDAFGGTLVFQLQPAEERSGGMNRMIDDGLLTRFPRPDYALALHTSADLPVGEIGLRAGPAMANVDSCDITLYGRSGHGAAPHLTVDPIVQASKLVLDLQTMLMASGELGAELDAAALPVRAAARRMEPGRPERALRRALYDGEDHCLLFAVREGGRLAPGGPLTARARAPERCLV